MHIIAINIFGLFGKSSGCSVIDYCICDGCYGKAMNNSDFCGSNMGGSSNQDYCRYQDAGQCGNGTITATDACYCVDVVASPEAPDTHACGQCDSTNPGGDKCDGTLGGTNDWVDCGQLDWACFNSAPYVPDIVCINNEGSSCTMGIDTPCFSADIF